MFLKPTAKPEPRRTPSPRVVLPAPPGSRIGSRGSSSGSGSESSAQRRITSDTGGEPVHLSLVREAHLDGPEAAHRSAGRVVRVHARSFDQGVRHAIRATGEGAGGGEHM